jgi:thioredoxin-like negative regulator of GroEL
MPEVNSNPSTRNSNCDAALGNSLGGLAQVVRIDIDKHPELARHYGVSSIPRMFVFYHGKILADRVGYADHKQLRDWVKGVQIQDDEPSATTIH